MIRAHLRPLKRGAAVISAVALFGSVAMSASAAESDLPKERVVRAGQAAPAAVQHPGTPSEDRARGKVWRGLKPGRANGLCKDAYEVDSRHGTVCSHGPDPAPAGVDVRKKRSLRELAAAASTSTTTTSGSSVPCYGDGSSGKRVQVIYARAADVADSYASVVDLLRQYAGNADSVFSRSAAKTGGVRHVRWVTDSCVLSVARAQLSTTGDDSFSAMTTELKNLGFTRSDRKYLVFADAAVYCGIGSIANDDSPGATNRSNTGGFFARVDRGCWGRSASVEAHEIMHNLGGVQLSAPHSSGGWHCTDDSDRMCYADATGVTMTYPCASTEEQLFDCGNDDYFHTNPPPTSYLATHWNSAMSDFLERVEPSIEPSPEPTATATATPSPTATVTLTTTSWSGSFNKKVTSKSYGITSGAGTITVVSTFSGGGSQTVTVKSSSGAVQGEQTGVSPVSVAVAAAAGPHTVVVSGTRNQSYTASATYPAP